MKRIISILSALIITLSAFFCTAVFAPLDAHGEAVQASLKILSGDVYPGCTLTVGVVASGSGVMAMQGKLIEYDRGVLEMKGAPVSGVSGWTYTEGGKNFMVEKPSFSSPDASGSSIRLVSFTFLVKDTVKIGDKISIDLRDVIISTSDGKVENGFSSDLHCSAVVKERPLSNDADLSSLKVEIYTLSPSFDPAVTEYRIDIPHTAEKINISPKTASSAAKYEVKGGWGLKYGENTVQIIVTSESGVQKTYTITVVRETPPSTDSALSSLKAEGFELQPAFDPSVTSYSLSVGSDVSSLDLLADASDEHATIDVSGNGDFAVGENTVKITVTAEDRTTSTVYTLTVNRARPVDSDATLSSFAFGPSIYASLTPEFDPEADEQNYTLHVVYETDDPSLFVYQANSPYAKVEAEIPETLEVGENLFKVTCTAEDGEHIQVYTLTVIREARIPNSEAALKSLTVNKGVMSPKFSPDVYSYLLVTDEQPGEIVFTAETKDPLAHVENARLTPVEGMNEQTVTVTAEDGTTTKEYVIYVFTPTAVPARLYLTGTPGVGGTLQAHVEGMNEAGTYVWFLNNEKIEGADTSSCVIPEGSEGKAIHAEYTDSTGKHAVSQTLSIPGEKKPEEQKDPEGQSAEQNPEDKTVKPEEPGRADQSGTLVLMIVLMVVCLAAGCAAGVFFARRGSRKKD